MLLWKTQTIITQLLLTGLIFGYQKLRKGWFQIISTRLILKWSWLFSTQYISEGSWELPFKSKNTCKLDSPTSQDDTIPLDFMSNSGRYAVLKILEANYLKLSYDKITVCLSLLFHRIRIMIHLIPWILMTFSKLPIQQDITNTSVSFESLKCIVRFILIQFFLMWVWSKCSQAPRITKTSRRMIGRHYLP